MNPLSQSVTTHTGIKNERFMIYTCPFLLGIFFWMMFNHLFRIWELYSIEGDRGIEWYWHASTSVSVFMIHGSGGSSKSLWTTALFIQASFVNRSTQPCQIRQCTSIYNVFQSVNATIDRVYWPYAYAIVSIVTEYQVALKNTKARLPLILTATTRSSGLSVFQAM